jgi:hypothetical protein
MPILHDTLIKGLPIPINGRTISAVPDDGPKFEINGTGRDITDLCSISSTQWSYGAAIGLVAWFALAAWILFDRQNDIGLPLAMVSVLLLVAVLLPWSLSLVWRRHQMPHQRPPGKTSFHDWRMGDFAVWAASFTARTRQSTCCCPWRQLHSA